MKAEQIRIIRADWEEIHPNARIAARLFYTKLFLIDPSLRVFFRKNVEEQTQRLMRALGIAVYGLGQPQVLVPLLHSLAEHRTIENMQHGHYDAVGKALLWTLKIVLGEKFTDESRQAWEHFYGTVTGTLRRAMRESAPGAAGLRVAA